MNEETYRLADRETIAIHTNKIRDLERRVERLEEEMDTARALIAQQIQLNLNARPQA